MKFIYSNCVGAFLFSDSGELLEKKLYEDTVDANNKLAENTWTDEEKKLLQPQTFFLGFKNEKIGDIKFTNDIRKLALVSEKLHQYDSNIREAIFLAAKNKIKNSVKDDELIIQTSGAIQELDKSVNLLTKRLREWYGLKNPEVAASIHDNTRFVQEVLEDSKKSSMGAELNAYDTKEIKELAVNVSDLITTRDNKEKYLDERMKSVCPNLLAVAGSAVGGKILAGAGSLKRLAVLPASTVQILGAERSMFKFLRKKSMKMPRFGILHEHQFISSAIESKKGKAARLLSDKISIAARVDYFKGKFVGDKLLKEIQDKLK